MDLESDKFPYADTHLEWLQEGDPSIVWQVLEYLIKEDSKEVHLERLHVELTGWGKQIIPLIPNFRLLCGC